MIGSQTYESMLELTKERSFMMLSQTAIVSITDMSGIILYANERLERVSGYSSSELIGQRHSLFDNGQHPPSFWKEKWDRIRNGYFWKGQMSGKAKNGDTFWVDSQVIPVTDNDGKVCYCLFIEHDITHEKEQEMLALEEQRQMLLEKERLTTLIESIPDIITFKDSHGRWLVANSAAKKLFGLNSINWMGKSDAELAKLDPAHASIHLHCMEGDRATWQSRMPTLRTDSAVDANGILREFEIRRMPMFHDDGSRMALLIVATDVTDGRQRESELQKTRTTLEQTMSLARVGGWEFDFVTGGVIWTGYTRKMAGLQEDYKPDLTDVLRFYKEGEDREKIVRLVNESKETGIGFDAELTVVATTGREFVIRTIAEPVMENGVCVRMVGYFQDITDEATLRRKNAQMERKFSHLIDKGADAILLCDDSGLITYTSQTCLSMLSTDSGSLLGQSWVHLFHHDDQSALRQLMAEVQRIPGKSVQLPELRISQHAGICLYIEGTVTNLLDDPNVGAMVCNFRDVTERRQTNLILQEKNKRLERIARLISHDVRGPVATMQGLMNAYNFKETDTPFNTVILAKLGIPMQKLDAIIRNIVQETAGLHDVADE